MMYMEKYKQTFDKLMSNSVLQLVNFLTYRFSNDIKQASLSRWLNSSNGFVDGIS
jgi:hypothetical protein